MAALLISLQFTTEILWFGLLCYLRWWRNWNRVVNAIASQRE
ncbi:MULTISPECIES: hypothetical protein [unclassified Moorena]|nr:MULTISPECIES: hypothetical protein [unclassified Moorena]